jgi:hypothetical protein
LNAAARRLVAWLALGLLLPACGAGAEAPPVAPGAAPSTIDRERAYNSLVALAPAGVSVSVARIDGDAVSVVGTAQRNAQVSDFLRALTTSTDFRNVQLSEVSMGNAGVSYRLSATIACAHGLARSGRLLCADPAARGDAIHRCSVDGTVTFQSTPCASGPTPK